MPIFFEFYLMSKYMFKYSSKIYIFHYLIIQFIWVQTNSLSQNKIFNNNLFILIKYLADTAPNSMAQYQQNREFLTISYRNGIYQGSFSKQTETRQGFGLVYATDNHMVMATTWHRDQINQATFIFYNHGHYVYGFWNMSVPHGFNAVKLDKIIIMANYQMGIIQGRILVMYEQYNLAIVLQKGKGQNQFVQIQKGDIFSDEDFNHYIKICKWPEFKEDWKTFIKFISANLVVQNSQIPKNQRTKLRLINQSYYRYGYNQGIAIVFDDEYKIISAGLHKKASLKSLGVRFPKQNFVEQGNFQLQNQIYAFNYGHRPDHKIGKIYSNFLLKSFDFVNKYINNPAKIFVDYLEQLVKTNLFRKLLAGQITTRKLQLSYGSPQTIKNNDSYQASNNKTENQLKPDYKPSTQKKSQNTKDKIPTKQQIAKSRKQEQQKLKQQKLRLMNYKRQIQDSINKKSRGVQFDQQQDRNYESQIVHKRPVDIATRLSHRNLDYSKQRRRSPIFTSQYNDSRSVSPVQASPFKQRMKSKIYVEEQPQPVIYNRKKYMYEPIQQMFPRHVDSTPFHNNDTNPKKYNSPHEELQYSRTNGFQNNSHVVPISVRRSGHEVQKNKQQTKIKTKQQKQKQRQTQKQRLLQRQRQIQMQIRKKQEQKQKQMQRESHKYEPQTKQKQRQTQNEQPSSSIKQKSKLQRYNKVYMQLKQKQAQTNQPYRNPSKMNNTNTNTNNQNYQKQHYRKDSQKQIGTISFRDPHLERQAQRQLVDNSIPNIIINNPNKSKSKGKNAAYKKIMGGDHRNSSPYQQKYNKQRSKQKDPYSYSNNNEKYNTKKNNVYLKQNQTIEEPNQPNSNQNVYKLKRQIKGSTYLQKHTKNKSNPYFNNNNTSMTPQKNAQVEDYDSKKYNKLIKGFNQNNRVYQKIQSPPSKPQKQSALSNNSIKNTTTPQKLRTKTEKDQPQYPNPPSSIKQKQKQKRKQNEKQAQQIKLITNHSNLDFQDTSFNPNSTRLIKNGKKSNKAGNNQVTPSKKKYQYVFQ